MCAWLRGLRSLVLLAIGWSNVASVALAAGADNAYVSVYSMEAAAAYTIDNDIYLLSEQLSSLVSELFVSVSAKDPFVLVSPESGNVRLAPGRGCGYRVRDESGSEDSFSGWIHAVKLDIAPSEKYVCWKASSATLELTSDSSPGGVVVWSSVPAGISGRGRTISFSPNRLSPGTYTVTARLARFPNYKATCIVHVVKVELVTPSGDPVSAPSDSGDGQNEFTYSSDSPGVLTMNLKAKVTPAGSALGVKDSCFFRVDFIRNSVMAWDSTSPSGRAAVSDDSLVATVTFTGLPFNNSDFGKKKALVYFGGILCDEKDYEVFFPKEAKNHPTGQADSPNWFYYWKQGDVCGIPLKCIYADDASYGYVIPGKDTILRLGPDAPTTNTGPENYEAGREGYGAITVTGSGKGIQCVAETVQHELHHLELYNKFHGQAEDPDEDGIPSSVEPTQDGISTHPNDPDTYRMGGGYSLYGDNEIRCRKHELSLTISVYPDKDWANPGCQSKSQFGPRP